ncbi:uncharacterized protein LOC127604260 isoform X3 [Hippocampus zosterae]|uniref:uncharacterized protein LOC127604260 isoform X3 n=1 Tax=Hippocampus zosterae TaxID=109293 RepID=UPI00223E5DA0|nr:uncharacterized protein LOC127604260 isoform X3 [Hippocampus zosterae]
MERQLTRSALAREQQEQRAEHSDNAQLDRQRGTELQTLDSVIPGRGRATTATEAPKGVKKRRSNPGRRQEAHDDDEVPLSALAARCNDEDDGGGNSANIDTENTDGVLCQKRVKKTVKQKNRMLGRHGLEMETNKTKEETPDA